MKKIVTPEQLSEGWYELVGGIAFHRRFAAVVKRPDGNYEVDQPQTGPTPIKYSGRISIPVFSGRFTEKE